MDNSAITPDANELLGTLDETEVVEDAFVTEAHQQDVELAAVAAMKGWRKIAERMQADIERFRTGAAMAVTPETPLEEIGQKYVISSTVAGHLQSYLDMVNGASEAAAEYERNQRK